MGDCSTVFVPRKPKPADHNHIKFLYFLIFFFRQPVELTNILLLLSRASQSHSEKEENKNKSSSSVYFCLSHSFSSSLYFFCVISNWKLNKTNCPVPSAASYMLLRRLFAPVLELVYARSIHFKNENNKVNLA